ncbi:MAG TPA: HPr family phosphocarrier protein [Phycisphaerae bacterium]|nr:HPr family phosphocarrier protein [Phycisphaerae bacterium]
MTSEAGGQRRVRDEAPVTIPDMEFRDLIARRGAPLVRAASYLSAHPSGRGALTRPLLGEMLSQAMQMEELLDAYGALNNRRWYPFRSLVAAIKQFSRVSYVLLHIRHGLPAYRLLPIEQDFHLATEQALAFTGDVLLRAAERLLGQAQWLHLPMPAGEPGDGPYAEPLAAGQLPSDRAMRKLENVVETVTHLATAFLNLAAGSELLHTPGRVSPEEYAACVPDPVSEEQLRYLQHRFHNLQSVYDTYVFETETESLDADLPVLRGHISVIFHLLETATGLAHYYERHVSPRRPRSSARRPPLISPEALLATLMDYSLAYASRYLVCAQNLCRTMLKRYAKIGRIEVPVPRYRGFHVRPATLVARVVRHYGSDVQMILDDEPYDARSPIEIFRANERINARKRRWLVSEIARLPLVQNGRSEQDVNILVRRVVLSLAEQGKVVIYEQPLPLREEPLANEGTLLEQVIDEIARLQATGAIDIEAELNIVFIGDERVLGDLELLANSGYGEDNFGNNVPLPEQLAYLRR